MNMASTQIEQLRTRFDAMDMAQKKEYIVNLRNELKSKHSPDLNRFLNECIQKYDDEYSANDSQKTANTSKTAKTLKVFANIVLVCGIVYSIIGSIIGSIIDGNVYASYYTWIFATAAYFLFVALSEIIQVLHDIRNKL